MSQSHPALLNHPTLQISDRASGIDEALSIYINQLVYETNRRNEDVITLSLGEAFFDLPMFDFSRLDKEKCFHYSHSRGVHELRQKVAKYYNSMYGSAVDPDHNLLISAGSKPAIFMALQAILNPGDEVLIPEPAWLSYQEHVRLLDAHPNFIRYDVPISEFALHIGPKSRVLVLNNPNNPSGRIYTADELRQLYEICRSRGVYVLVDEAYSDFLREGDAFQSMASIVPDLDGVIVVNSLSKNLGMSGFRIGYIIADATFIDVVLKLNQHIITCAPSILQYYVSEFFDDIIRVTLPQIKELVLKRDRVADMLDRLQLKRLPGGGTFYFFISMEDSLNSSFDVALKLLMERGVAVVPGSAYGDSTEKFLRISFGTEPDERIEQALLRIKEVLAEPKMEAGASETRLRAKGFPIFQKRKNAI